MSGCCLLTYNVVMHSTREMHSRWKRMSVVLGDKSEMGKSVQLQNMTSLLIYHFPKIIAFLLIMIPPKLIMTLLLTCSIFLASVVF